MKVRLIEDAMGRGHEITFRCPGCGSKHFVPIDFTLSNGATWKFNGDVNKPTLDRSVSEKVGPFPEGSKYAGQIRVCHFNLRDGTISFLSDSTHEMAGKSTVLKDVEEYSPPRKTE